jgi:hypothetical protein
MLCFSGAGIAQRLLKPLAFPTAEGFGKYAWGGRGGKVLRVTNLNDSGPGSLRSAVESKGARIIVFSVSGNIPLASPLRIDNDSVTIAGQSAPGDGICLQHFPLIVNASDVVIRYIRCRLGDHFEHDADAFSGGRYGQHDVIIDHVSTSWSIDECLSIYKTQRLTVQWCLVAQSLAKSKHTKGAHGFGGIWGGFDATFHHNLLADHTSRNPRFASVDGTKNVDFRNNVIWNWGFKSAYGGGHYAEVNMVNNYYKPGPASEHKLFLEVADDGTGLYYIDGNVMEGKPEFNSDNWKAVGGKNPILCRVNHTFKFEPITTQTAKGALPLVLKVAGCSLHRDSFDSTIVHEVATGKPAFTQIGIVNSQDEAGGWPVLRQSTPPVDTDLDGMPDRWEYEHGLNAKLDDSAQHTLDEVYTNIEIYLNCIEK